MSYTTLAFFVFLAAVTLLYYLFPGKQYRWVILLAASCFFYLYASVRYAGYILFTTLSAYGATLWMERYSTARKATLAAHKQDWEKSVRKTYKKKTESTKRAMLALVLVLNFGLLAFLKFWNAGVEGLAELLGAPQLSAMTLQLVLPLGISFYTFQTMAYVIDVCRGKAEAEKNPLKLLLYVSFFPQIIQGPIGVWADLAPQLTEGHDFSYDNLKHGLELILWGFFKKLVIADRAVTALGFVTADYTQYSGATLAFTLLVYALQLYADFSGGIDISLGAARILGIEMAPNFRQPYFATSLTNFWQRWHISLGNWMKNYLFYPLALSDTGLAITAKLSATRFGRTKAGSHIAHVLPTCIATFIVFFAVGIWHGVGWAYLGYGIYNGTVMALATLLAPVFHWQNERLHIREESVGLRMFRIVRTFLIVLIGNVCDLAPGLRACADWIARCFADFRVSTAVEEIRTLSGWESADYWILLGGAAVLFVVSALRERKPTQSLRERLDGHGALRWALALGCLAAIVIFGTYGPGYSAADFVYMQF